MVEDTGLYFANWNNIRVDIALQLTDRQLVAKRGQLVTLNFATHFVTYVSEGEEKVKI